MFTYIQTTCTTRERPPPPRTTTTIHMYGTGITMRTTIDNRHHHLHVATSQSTFWSRLHHPLLRRPQCIKTLANVASPSSHRQATFNCLSISGGHHMSRTRRSPGSTLRRWDTILESRSMAYRKLSLFLPLLDPFFANARRLCICT
jgi:hypothetical protein